MLYRDMPSFDLPDLDGTSAIVILTGAGISKESGLDTFRDAGGVWSKVRIEDVATPEAFAANPVRVQDFYNHRRAGLLDADIKSNAAHQALAKLQQNWPGDFLLVTQNVDDLHERGGSNELIHMHGELLKSRCTECHDVEACIGELSSDSVCANCGTIGSLRPDVVWFGERPMGMDRIYAALARCALFVSIGTSGNVYPAAGFVQEARFVGGAHTVELNLEPSAGVTDFEAAYHGPATKLVPAFVDAVLGKA